MLTELIPTVIDYTATHYLLLQ